MDALYVAKSVSGCGNAEVGRCAFPCYCLHMAPLPSIVFRHSCGKSCCSLLCVFVFLWKRHEKERFFFCRAGEKSPRKSQFSSIQFNSMQFFFFVFILWRFHCAYRALSIVVLRKGTFVF